VPPTRIGNPTLRQIVHASVSGAQLRVRVSNASGTAPLVVGAALTFSGLPSSTIPERAKALSDPDDFAVRRSATSPST